MTDIARWNPFRFDRRREKRPNDEPRQNGGSLARRDTWEDPFDQMRNQMNQVVQSFFGDDFFAPALRSMSQAPAWFGDFSPATFNPTVDVVNENKHLVVSAELPGLDKSDVNLTVNDHTLTIEGEKRHEKKDEEKGCYRTERYFGQFRRTIPLPEDVDTKHCEATFDNGVLTVRLPKTGAKEPSERKIELK